MAKWTIPPLVLILLLIGMYSSGLFDTSPLPADPVSTTGSDTPAAASGSADDDPQRPSTPDAAAAPVPITGDGDGADFADLGDLGGLGEILGRVVDETGAPVEGAVLHLLPDPSGSVAAGAPVPDLDAPTGRGESDADGRFRFASLEPEARYAVVVRATDRVGARRRDLAPDGESVEIVLRPGETVHGVVVDPQGRPVPDAWVVAGRVVDARSEALAPPFGADVVVPEATTAGDGTFTLAGIPRGAFSVTAFHERFSPSAPMNLMQALEAITLTLRADTVVAGRVVDDLGVPVEGAIVQSAAVSRSRIAGAPQARTAGAGEFRLGGFPPGPLSLVARAEGYPSRTVHEPGAIAAGATVGGIEIVLERGARIVGTVVDLAGTPVAGASVSLRRRGVLGLGGGPTTTTDDDGGFVLDGVGPGRGETESVRHVQITHPLHAVTDSEEFTVATAAEIDLGTITLGAAIVIAGRITDPEGRAIAEAPVELRAIDEGTGGEQIVIELFGAPMPVRVFRAERGRTRSDADGFYRLPVKEPGRYRVVATARGHQRAESGELDIAERSREDVDLRLPLALRIEGLVVDELGLPCEGVVVRASAEGRPHQDAPPSVADGRFQVDGLGPGGYRLAITGDGWSVAPDGDPGEIDAGTRGVTLVATRPGQIAGRIVDRRSGLPVTEFSIRSERDVERQPGVLILGGRDPGDGIRYQDPDGSFWLDGVAPGRHRLTVRARGWIEASELVEVVAGATSEVVIPLEVAAAIVGRLVDPAGEPIAGARVHHEQLGDTEGKPAQPATMAIGLILNGGEVVFGGGGPRGTLTDEEGFFRIEGLDDAEFRVRFRHDAFRPASEEPVVTHRGSDTDLGTITMSRGSTVTGRVRGGLGANLAWASVSVRPTAGGDARKARIDGRGDFRIGGLDAGSFAVTVEYMLERPENAGGNITLQHAAGTVDLAADDERELDIVLPR